MGIRQKLCCVHRIADYKMVRPSLMLQYQITRLHHLSSPNHRNLIASISNTSNLNILTVLLLHHLTSTLLHTGFWIQAHLRGFHCLYLNNQKTSNNTSYTINCYPASTRYSFHVSEKAITILLSKRCNTTIWSFLGSHSTTYSTFCPFPTTFLNHSLHYSWDRHPSG